MNIHVINHMFVCLFLVVGCELSPTAFLTIKGGMMDNLTRAKIVENAAHRFQIFLLYFIVYEYFNVIVSYILDTDIYGIVL